MKKIIFVLCLSLFAKYIVAQSVAINTDGSIANGTALLDVKSTTKGFLPPRLDSNQRNAIVSPAAGLTIYNTSIKAFQCYNGTAWYSTVHYIGEHYGGGTVFYIYDNGQHGLIAAPYDLGFLAWNSQWPNIYFSGSTGDGLNAGLMNTVLSVVTSATTMLNFAARACADYSITVNGITYGDWYLPSKYELNLLYLQKNLVGNFGNFKYWSSTEMDAFNTWYQNFITGIQATDVKNIVNNCRAIRAF